MNNTVVFGIIGTQLDRGRRGTNRWDGWRPTVAIFQQDDFVIDRLELISTDPRANDLVELVETDVRAISPETDVRVHHLEMVAPWDFESVYSILHDFACAYPFDVDIEDYFVHITTGTHVAQICFFLLTEARYFPAQLLQASPPRRERHSAGSIQIIDLELSRYAKIAERFQAQADAEFLKGGIGTRNGQFNHLISRIEQVAIRSTDPILLTAPTGAGKSELARRQHHELNWWK